VSPGVFFQGNEPLRAVLLEAVLEAAGCGARCLELCAGAGFFTLGLAARFGEVLAVESSPPAVRDLRANLAAARLANVRIECAPLAGLLAKRSLAGFAPDAIVVDPPRTGLGADVAEALAGLGARRLVYVSCAPPTLARDLAALVRHGFRLASVRGFDLFPQTPHVEALARLER
jgi:tRNA/tmRNA/rRNA uracil-C5-methylase (TrmA/RlmC/RlmD family)